MLKASILLGKLVIKGKEQNILSLPYKCYHWVTKYYSRWEEVSLCKSQWKPNDRIGTSVLLPLVNEEFKHWAPTIAIITKREAIRYNIPSMEEYYEIILPNI